MDYQKIAQELDFSLADTEVLVDYMQAKYKELNNTQKIIEKWENECFRANNLEEVLNQYDYGTKPSELANSIRILPSGMLIVI